MHSILIYVQHLLGIGHLMRARLIAEALADQGLDVHLVSGGMPIGGRALRGVRVVQLPPVRVCDASFTPLRDADFNPVDDPFRTRRAELLVAAYEAVRPSAVVFETFPFGRRAMRFELFPLLARIDATHPRPLVLSSIREILQVQAKPEREREMLGWAARWFDAILVHGDRRFARFEDTFSFAEALAPPVHYTGFVFASPPRPRDADDSSRREVVVSAGGGGVGIELLDMALAAQTLSAHRELTWRVLAGPNIGDEGLRRLEQHAGSTAIVERSRTDFAALLKQAFVSISQAGYNTTLDVIASGARPVIVPFTGNGETEQRARGERLREFGLAVVVDDRTLTPQRLADAVDAAAARRDWGTWQFDSDGAARTAQLVVELLRSGSSRARADTASSPVQPSKTSAA
jgi:predicted glycosyltransferase